jgi:thiamine-monophosphate kinase
MPTRLDARPGDLVAVTGTIGDAALGLLHRLEPQRAERWGLTPVQGDHLRNRYLLPRPRIEIADAVGRHARAAMDVSDGLVGDLERLCRASRVTARIEIERLPLSDAARQALGADIGALETVLSGGDDYEILLTLEPGSWPFFRAECEAQGVAASIVGETGRGEPGLVTVTKEGAPLSLSRSAYSHL